MDLEKKDKVKKIEGSLTKTHTPDENMGLLNTLKYNMNLKKTVTISVIAASFICALIGINNASAQKKVSASITKSSIAESKAALKSMTYEGEELYVANSTFYDYYSDSQVGKDSTPKKITDALSSGKNTFSKFNKKLMSIMKYNDPNLCPAKYPLYQGRPGALIDMDGICYPQDEALYKKNNYWAAANWGQVSAVATQGLIDDTLMTDSSGNTHLTQSNPSNGKSAKVPFFDEEFLTKNKFNDSELTLGSVKKNVAFPFRRVEKDGIIYYEFYSSKDTVRMNNSGQLDYLGYNKTSEQVKDAEGKFGFFPYNTASEGKSESLNFGHGVKIELPFNMTKDGKIGGKDMVFEFSGDDDVWVFIDGILALDIGGNHGEVEGSINFATGESTVNKVKNNTVAFSSHSLSSFKTGENTFSSLGITNAMGVLNNHKTKFSAKLKQSLKDVSKTHTLTLFYMERGLNVANMKMSFNLPEPSILTVTNEVKADNVGSTFKNETSKVANKDSFVYDVLDKTITRKDEIEIKNDEAITFSNEFDKKDNLLVQQKALKISSRDLTTLYSTKWTLTDLSTELSKGNNLIVTDSRATVDKAFLFANKTGDKTPILTASYINTPNIGDLEVKCNVTDSYKKKFKDYKTKTFTYIIKYSNVFGGNSESIYYKGKYDLYKSEKAKETAATVNGKIQLNPGDKFIIKDIPVTTKFEIIVSLDDGTSIKTIKATDNFTSKSETKTTTGSINQTSNQIDYTFTNKTSDNKTQNVTIKTDKEKPKQNPTDELEDINETDALDASPTTSDDAKINLWTVFAILSIIVCVTSFIYLFKQEQSVVRISNK